MNQDQERFQTFRDYLQQISIKELSERINLFKNMIDLRTISEQRLKEELNRLLAVHINGSHHSLFMKKDTITRPNDVNYFYRVRKASKHDNVKSGYFPSIKVKSDIWAKPTHMIDNYGRLNRIKESMLYTTNQVTNAIYETDCQDGELFFLLVYKNAKPLRVSQIHNINYIDELGEVENAKLLILHHFLLTEFTKIVPKGKEYMYKTSIVIFNEFFNSPYIDAFTYPSIKSLTKTGYNICFSEQQAEKNLEFSGLMVCELVHSVTGKEEFLIKPHFDGFLNEYGTFSFYPYNCDVSREKFGFFTNVRDLGL